MSLISLSIVYDYDNHDGKDYHDDHDNDDFHDDYENQPDHLFALGARGERSRFEEEAQINIVRPETDLSSRQSLHFEVDVKVLVTLMMMIRTWRGRPPSYSHNSVQFGCTPRLSGRAWTYFSQIQINFEHMSYYIDIVFLGGSTSM